MEPDCPNASTPTGTTGAPNTEPTQAKAWLAASWTVTIGAPRSASRDQAGQLAVAGGRGAGARSGDQG